MLLLLCFSPFPAVAYCSLGQPLTITTQSNNNNQFKRTQGKQNEAHGFEQNGSP
jgi:hypothetical protein